MAGQSISGLVPPVKAALGQRLGMALGVLVELGVSLKVVINVAVERCAPRACQGGDQPTTRHGA